MVIIRSIIPHMYRFKQKTVVKHTMSFISFIMFKDYNISLRFHFTTIALYYDRKSILVMKIFEEL